MPLTCNAPNNYTTDCTSLCIPSLLGRQKRGHGIIERTHERRMMDGRLGSREDGGETLVSVRQDVLVLVVLPGVEHLGHVHVIPVVRFLYQVVHKVGLEVDVVVTVLQGFVPGRSDGVENPIRPAHCSL